MEHMWESTIFLLQASGNASWFLQGCKKVDGGNVPNESATDPNLCGCPEARALHQACLKEPPLPSWEFLFSDEEFETKTGDIGWLVGGLG